MADVRTSYPTLEDANNSNQGAAQSLKTEGQTSTSEGTNYAGQLVATDAGGLLRFLKVNSNNELIVTTNADNDDFACLSAQGQLAGTGTEASIAEITLQNSTEYDEIEMSASCFRDATIIVDRIDDEGVGDVVTEVARLRLGKENSICCSWKCYRFTSGGTGTVKLRVRGFNLNTTSDMDATITVREKQ
jgi:hypothetical protein